MNNISEKVADDKLSMILDGDLRKLKDPGNLKKIAAGISKRYLENNEDPTEMLKNAIDKEALTPNQAQRVAEFTNLAINRYMISEAEDRTFTFPLADSKKAIKQADVKAYSKSSGTGTKISSDYLRKPKMDHIETRKLFAHVFNDELDKLAFIDDKNKMNRVDYNRDYEIIKNAMAKVEDSIIYLKNMAKNKLYKLAEVTKRYVNDNKNSSSAVECLASGCASIFRNINDDKTAGEAVSVFLDITKELPFDVIKSEDVDRVKTAFERAGGDLFNGITPNSYAYNQLNEYNKYAEEYHRAIEAKKYLNGKMEIILDKMANNK